METEPILLHIVAWTLHCDEHGVPARRLQYRFMTIYSLPDINIPPHSPSVPVTVILRWRGPHKSGAWSSTGSRPTWIPVSAVVRRWPAVCDGGPPADHRAYTHSCCYCVPGESWRADFHKYPCFYICCPINDILSVYIITFFRMLYTLTAIFNIESS